MDDATLFLAGPHPPAAAFRLAAEWRAQGRTVLTTIAELLALRTPGSRLVVCGGPVNRDVDTAARIGLARGWPVDVVVDAVNAHEQVAWDGVISFTASELVRTALTSLRALGAQLVWDEETTSGPQGRRRLLASIRGA